MCYNRPDLLCGLVLFSAASAAGAEHGLVLKSFSLNGPFRQPLMAVLRPASSKSIIANIRHIVIKKNVYCFAVVVRCSLLAARRIIISGEIEKEEVLAATEQALRSTVGARKMLQDEHPQGELFGGEE